MTARVQFEQDLVEMQGELRAYAIGMLRDRARAEDMVSISTINALRSWEQYQAGTNFKAWMYRILRNTILSDFRRNKHAPVQMDPADLGELGVTDARQDDAVEHSEIRRAVSLMPIEWRHVLLRICVEGRSYEEAAQEIGVSIGTIKSRLWRARLHVEQLMGHA